MNNINQKGIIGKGISGSTLKIIAIISMFIDHIGAAFPIFNYSPLLYRILRAIGRIAFPIFCFLIVEGFLHTKNVKKYFLRLLLFAFISEIPFDLAFFNKTFYIGYQNVFFTLAIGLTALIFIKKYEKNVFFQCIVIVLASVLAEILNTDYASFGVILIVLIYLFRDRKILRNIIIAVMTLVQIPASLSVLFIWQYNGKRGINLKYVFYAFYPVHLIIFYTINRLLI